MSEERIFELLKDCKELSSLPQVLAEVIRVSDDEDSSASDIADVILKDPPLSARILRVVNSSFYGQTRAISTINQAVVTLGIRAVKALALSTSLYRLFDSDKPTVDRIRFWRHSLEVAIACREIAKACSYQPEEEAFVAGLMHDIGILILESAFEDQFKRIWKLVESGESIVKQEKSTWGTNHALVAKFLLDQWKLPEFIGGAIATHHNNHGDYENTPQNRLGRIINLGNRISKFRTCQTPPMTADDMLQIEKLSESLGIGPTVLAELQEKTFPQRGQQPYLQAIPVR
jgi:HD-like signal output (HDOD) protein